MEAAPVRERAFAPTVFAVGFALCLTAVAGQTVGDLLNHAALGDRVALDANNDESVWTWCSVAATLLTAYGVLLRGLVVPRRAVYAVVLAVCVAFLSLDDEVGIHERLAVLTRRDVLGLSSDWINRMVWPAIYLPILAATFLLFWLVSREVGERSRRWLIAGLGLLVLGVALEVFTAPFGTDRATGGWGYHTEVVAEEGVELAGWVLIATAVTADLVDRLTAVGSRLRS